MNERVRIKVNGIEVKMYGKFFPISGETLYRARTTTLNDLKVLVDALDAQFRAWVKAKEISPEENIQSFSFSVEFSDIKAARLIPIITSLQESLKLYRIQL